MTAALRRRRSPGAMHSPACRASAVAVIVRVDQQRAVADQRGRAGLLDSTGRSRRSLRIGPSSATRFMPSLIGVTIITSASPQAASEREVVLEVEDQRIPVVGAELRVHFPGQVVHALGVGAVLASPERDG